MSPLRAQNPSTQAQPALLPKLLENTYPSPHPSPAVASSSNRIAPRSPHLMADKEPVVERPEAAEEEDASAAAAAAGEEEDTGAQVAPIVRLEEVDVTTGEEDEDVLLDM